MNAHPKARLTGLVGGIALGMLIAAQSLSQIIAAGTLDAHDTTARFQMMMAMLVGLLLLALNIGMTVYLLRKKAVDRRDLAWMWLPAFCAMLIAPAYNLVADRLQAAIREEHPPIAEWHVNLSGRTFWLAPEVAPSAFEADPEAIRLVFRQQALKNRTDPMREYAGALPAPGFKGMTVFGSSGAVAPTTLPVSIGPIPSIALIERAFPYGGPYLDYMYYHYPDRIEVAPVLRLSRLELRKEATAQVPLVIFYPRNLAGPPIIRIEVDGQTLALEHPVTVQSGDTPCRIYGHPALSGLDGPLKIRWQVAQANPVWREAKLTVPLFVLTPGEYSSARRNAIHLYFLADGSIAAQREQLLGVGDETPGVRFTEPPPQLNTPVACGTAEDVYRENEQYRKPD